MDPVIIHECFVWLQAVQSLVIASPSEQEFYGRSSLMIAAMRKDLSNNEFMFVLLGDVLEQG